MNIKKTLDWCGNNEISINISNEDGLLVITARGGNIFSEIPIGDEVNVSSVGEAVVHACYNVEQGTKFHQRFGAFPKIGKGDS
jgi:hypothetical protein